MRCLLPSKIWPRQTGSHSPLAQRCRQHLHGSSSTVSRCTSIDCPELQYVLQQTLDPGNPRKLDVDRRTSPGLRFKPSARYRIATTTSIAEDCREKRVIGRHRRIGDDDIARDRLPFPLLPSSASSGRHVPLRPVIAHLLSYCSKTYDFVLAFGLAYGVHTYEYCTSPELRQA